MDVKQAMAWLQWIRTNLKKPRRWYLVLGALVLVVGWPFVQGAMKALGERGVSGNSSDEPHMNQSMTNSPGSTQFMGPVTGPITVLPASPVERLDEGKIALGLRYAYEFDGYLGATNVGGNEDRELDPAVPLRSRYSADKSYRFRFTVINKNVEMPFKDVLLQMIFLDHGVTITEFRGWACQRPNERYSYRFPSPINNMPQNAETLAVTFPHPGTYSLRYIIDGSDVESIQGLRQVELY